MSAQDHVESAKAWASGRVLTSAQRARKQRKDRISKQQLHQRQQEHLEGLENRIIRLERTVLEAFVPLLPEDGHTAKANHDVPFPSPDEVCRPSPVSFGFQGCTSAPLSQWPSSVPAKDQQLMQSPRTSDMTSVPTHPSEQCSGKNMNYLRQTAEILGSVHALHPSQVCLDDHLNQDLLIRAILEGWDILQDRNNVCPLWDILRQIDASINIRSGLATRLTMLRGIHQLLLAIVLPSLVVALPAWYRPRPSQILHSHELVLDYFAWPGFRERLILFHQPQLDDSFWDRFARFFFFSWPYSFSSAYEYDAVNNRYGFSDFYTECTHDLQRYGMDPEFFAAYPETYDDIY